MTEHIQPEWLQIPHKDVECCVAINGLMRVFSTDDTAYWLYPEQYEMFNNISKWNGNNYEVWFGADAEDYDMLHEAGITQVTAPYPSDEVIAQFWEVEMDSFDSELEHFEDTGDWLDI